MCQPGPFATAADALAAVSAGLSHLAGLDLTTLTTAEQADCLLALGRADAQAIAARSAILAAFERGRGFEDDAAGGARSWLRWPRSWSCSWWCSPPRHWLPAPG
jgi:hypothetical protein